MSINNKDILLQANACITNGDYEGFLSYCTEDTVWNFIGDKILVGKPAVRNYIKEAYLEPPHFDVDKIVGEDDQVIAVGRISLKDTAGRLINYDYCDVWQIRDAKLAKLKAFVVQQKV